MLTVRREIHNVRTAPENGVFMPGRDFFFPDGAQRMEQAGGITGGKGRRKDESFFLPERDRLSVDQTMYISAHKGIPAEGGLSACLERQTHFSVIRIIALKLPVICFPVEGQVYDRGSVLCGDCAVPYELDGYWGGAGAAACNGAEFG